MSFTRLTRELIRTRTREEQAALERMRSTGTLIEDDRRSRPLFFDGRFLAARDLTREQNYFLTRQADLGRAGGAGVVAGLQVAHGARSGELVIRPGHGVTESGESVVLQERRVIRLSDVPETQRLNATFGLKIRPGPPPRGRSGLFVLALRPVEFSANPIASYPTTVTGRRSVQDGDIVEAAAITLIPYRDLARNADRLPRRRRRVAHALFVNGNARGLPVDAVPLAMVGLERNLVRWLDVFMVRREFGADHGDVLGFGLAPRAVREAFLVQYDRHLADVLRRRMRTGRGRAFPATEHFDALPSAGRMPIEALNTADFSQTFFPPDVQVDLSIIPDDELPALVEESLSLPPIDLRLEGEALASTSVLLVAPRPRARVETLRQSLDRLVLPLRPAALGHVARRSPIETLRGLRLVRRPVLRPVGTEELQAAAWRAELEDVAGDGEGTLWFVRRRNIDYRSDIVGSVRGISFAPDAEEEERLEVVLLESARDAGVLTRVNRLRGLATPFAMPTLTSLLSDDVVRRSPLLSRAAVIELEDAGGALDAPTVRTVADTFTDPDLGEGLERLRAVDDSLETRRTSREALAASALEIDRVARSLDTEDVVRFSERLIAAGDNTRAINRAVSAFSDREPS